jgi:hypothetical protein
MTPKEKAIALSYVLSQLLQDNLDIAVHEMKVSNHPNAGQLYDKLCKLRGANRNAFKTLERNVSDLDNLKEDITTLLESVWE